MTTTMGERPHTYTAFAGDRIIASGDLRSVVLRVKERADQAKVECVLFFDDESGQQLELSLDGTPEEVLARMTPDVPAPGRGRPKLGVTSREVTLLPRHWEWLEQQPQGISATLRRLVEEARKREPDEDVKRNAREAAHRFMTTMAGDRPGYEEALRSLYAKNRDDFERRIKRWPADIRKHVSKLADASF